MKIFKTILLAFVLGVIAFSSCKKEELTDSNLPNPNPPTNDLGKLSCFISQGYWEMNTYTASYANDVVNIMAVTLNNDTMFFNIHINGSATYYHLNKDNKNLAIYKSVLDNTTVYSTSLDPVGNENIGHIGIAIDTINHIMSGSFAYKAYNSVDASVQTVTEGEFINIKYSAPDNIEGNSMSAIILNDTIPSLSPVVASKNYLNYFDIRAYNSTEYISLYFDGTNVNEGDNIILGSTNLAYYYDGTSIVQCTSGYILIAQHNKDVKTLKGSFEFYMGTDSVKNGQFFVNYFEQ